jgi:hypothetical protein
MTDQDDRLHCLYVDRRRLRESVWLWRAVAFTLLFIVIVMGYGYVMHWTGAW